MQLLRKHSYTIGKFLLAFSVLALVLYKSDHEKIIGYLVTLGPVYLTFALLSFNVAQYFSALRMRYYYLQVGRPLGRRYSVVLYYVGMFYNLIFPGGIGGDAYKVFLLKKRADFPVREGIRLMLANRANGLYVLAIMMLLLIWNIDVSNSLPLGEVMLVVLVIVCTVGYFSAARLFFGESGRMAMGAMKYSVAVQGLSVLALVILWRGLGDGSHLAEYIVLFLAAAIVGVLPVSVGGLGIRELTFFYGAAFFKNVLDIPLDPEFGIALSLVFFAVNALSSFVGLIWIHSITGMDPHPAGRESSTQQ